MWGTFLIDVYDESERQEMANALETLCSPADDYGFASGGVYCYWSVRERIPLYIGRAIDLPDRFRQHNGLRGPAGPGNKVEKINTFFEDDPVLGFSVLVRSTLSQSETSRRISRAEREEEPLHWVEDPESVSTEIEKEIALAEGTAIRSHFLRHGRLPAWNRIHGELSNWNESMRRPDSSGSLFCGTADSLLQARRSLRELATEPFHTAFEQELHGARIMAVAETIRDNRQLDDFDILSTLDRMSVWTRAELVAAMRDQAHLLQGPWMMSELPTELSYRQRRAWTEGEPIPPSPLAPALRLDDEMPWG